MNEDASRRIALKIQIGDQERDVTFDELTLSNNLGLEALVKILVDKGVFKPEELQEVMDHIRQERYKDPEQK